MAIAVLPPIPSWAPFFVKEIAMVKPENQVDKQRFEERKDAAEHSGKNEEKAIKQAAGSVKQQREQEGRSKKDDR
jgi:hypothetical protein